MRRIGISLAILLALACWHAPPVLALEAEQGVLLQDAATATGNGGEVVVTGYNSLGLDITISDTATITFEGIMHATGTYKTVSCAVGATKAVASTATASGAYQCNVAGLLKFRARISSYTGGTVTVTGLLSTATFAGAGGLPPVGTEGECLMVTSGVASWEPCTSTTPTLDQAFDQGKVIDGANSVANAVRIGDGTTPICLYTDATLGPQVRPCTDANVKTIIPNGFTWCLHDVEGAACVEEVDPDAATTLAMYTYAAAYRPKKSVWFGAGSLSTDGTQCAAPAEVTINSGPKIWTIICTDNDASSIYGSIKMPDSYDGGTITFTHSYIQTAADTGVLNGDIAAQCRGNGEVPSSTWGSEVAIDDAAVVGSNSNDFTTSAAVTPAGTCAASDMLYFRYQLDATGTTTAVATLNHVGFLMEYSITSRSD